MVILDCSVDVYKCTIYCISVLQFDVIYYANGSVYTKFIKMIHGEFESTVVFNNLIVL